MRKACGAVETEDDPPHFVNVGHRGELVLYAEDGTTVLDRFQPRYGTVIFHPDGAAVERDAALFEWDTWNTPIVAREKGIVRFVDIKEKVTLRDEIDETTKKRVPVIVEDQEKVLQPHIEIVTRQETVLNSYALPTGSRLQVRDGQEVRVGDVLAKIRRETPRPATSPAVCRACPSSSRRASRRSRRSSARSTASCGSARGPAG